LGSLEVPMTDEQLKEKFMDQVLPVLGASASSRASDAAWMLGDAENVLPFMHRFGSASPNGLKWTEALDLGKKYSA
jgi:hypothetical protein